jgi:hypothetical protein
VKLAHHEHALGHHLDRLLEIGAQLTQLDRLGAPQYASVI